jgi:uncharacterized protein YigA (DUF484 family)
MVRKHDDIPEAAQPLTDRQVADHLRGHPDFLVRHPELAASLAPPSRWPRAGKVVDLQAFMIERMREDMDQVRSDAEQVFATIRSNVGTQNRTHRAVLDLLAAEDMAALAQVVGDDLAPMLDVDVATLAFEESETPLPVLAGSCCLRVPAGTVDRVLGGADRTCALTEQVQGDPVVFGDGAGLVLSSAVVRLSPGGRCPPGLLALGSRHAQTFHTGQGTELVVFLARVLAQCVRRFVG